jgi:uncharacterized repeat protein (TIGR03803 family)
MKRRYLALLAAFTFAAALPMFAASSPKGRILYTFKGGSDGSLPLAPLVADAQGNLYGTTQGGGGGSSCDGSTEGCGTVFELVAPSSPSGTWREKILHSFTGGGGDGFFPTGGLIFDAAGNLYGTTDGGGDVNSTLCGNPVGFGCGLVFELSPPNNGESWNETILHTFEGGTDGGWPESSLVFDGKGNLYGTTAIGDTGNGGTIFELSPAGNGVWTEAIIYSFMNVGDGYTPEGPLVFDNAGNLYGTTTVGPYGQGCLNNNGCGTVFQLVPPVGGGAWTGGTLFAFTGINGANPHGGVLIDPSGNIFGTTTNGGLYGGYRETNGGVAFELMPPQSGGPWTEIVLWNFMGGSDAHPIGLVEDASGNLYGTAEGSQQSDCGEIFKLSDASGGWSRTALHSFSIAKFNQGCFPPAPLIYGKWQALYGTTYEGGSAACGNGLGCGTVFGFLP